MMAIPGYGVVVRTVSAAQQGVGLPDNTAEVRRAKSMGGSVLEFNEQILWLTLLAVEAPGGASITRGPISPDEGWISLPEVYTGLTVVPIAPGVDYNIREFWQTFTEPAVSEIHQGGTYNDVSCILPTDSCPSPPISVFQTGWTRSLLEDIALASTLQVRVKNLGQQPMIGKIWFIGVQRAGSYLWF